MSKREGPGNITTSSVGHRERLKVRIDELRKSLADLPELLDVEKVVEILKLDAKEVYRLIHEGKLKHQLVSRVAKIEKESIFTLLENPTITPQ